VNCDEENTHPVISVGVPSGRHEGVCFLWGFPLALQKMMQENLRSPEWEARGHLSGDCGVRILTHSLADVGSVTGQNDSLAAPEQFRGAAWI
jgi:hypothetical protein